MTHTYTNTKQYMGNYQKTINKKTKKYIHKVICIFIVKIFLYAHPPKFSIPTFAYNTMHHFTD